jgi:hypothetical protein
LVISILWDSGVTLTEVFNVFDEGLLISLPLEFVSPVPEHTPRIHVFCEPFFLLPRP